MEANIKKVTIALIAHDNRKMRMVEWVNQNRDILAKHCQLVATEGTAKSIRQITGLEVATKGHGPEGGDVRVAYDILEGHVDVLIFFIDTMTAHGHEHDVQTLIRICVTHNIPLALNASTADCVIRALF